MVAAKELHHDKVVDEKVKGTTLQAKDIPRSRRQHYHRAGAKFTTARKVRPAGQPLVAQVATSILAGMRMNTFKSSIESTRKLQRLSSKTTVDTCVSRIAILHVVSNGFWCAGDIRAARIQRRGRKQT